MSNAVAEFSFLSSDFAVWDEAESVADWCQQRWRTWPADGDLFTARFIAVATLTRKPGLPRFEVGKEIIGIVQKMKGRAARPKGYEGLPAEDAWMHFRQEQLGSHLKVVVDNPSARRTKRRANLSAVK